MKLAGDLAEQELLNEHPGHPNQKIPGSNALVAMRKKLNTLSKDWCCARPEPFSGGRPEQP
jgi:hypothetical protein